MIQNDRRRTNAAVDQTMVVNQRITTPVIKTLDLTVLRSFTLGPDVVFTGASSVVTNNVTTSEIKTTDIQTTTLESTTINTTTINTTNLTVGDTVTANRLRLLANTTQMKIGSTNEVVLDINTSSNRTITLPPTSGNANFILSESAQTINGVKTFTDMVVFLSSFTLASLTLSAVSNQLTLGTVSTITLNAPTPAASRTYTMPDVLANANFVMTEGAQTLNGVKTFSATAVFLAGFTLASLTLSAVSNQLTLGTISTITVNAPTPAASRTYTMPDVLANANFVMTEGAQTLNGVKTFSSTAVFLAGFTLASLTLSAVSNQLTLGSVSTIILTAPTPAATRTYTIPDVLANASFVLTEGTQSISGLKTFFNNTTFDANLLLNNMSVIAFTKPTNQMTFTSAGTSITLNVPAPGANRVYTMADVGVDASFVMTAGTQTIGGSKTFSQQTQFDSPLVLTSVASQFLVGPAANTILSIPTPAAPRVYTMTDVGASASFVMSEGTQTINGAKTFSGLVAFNGGFSGSAAAITLTNATNQIVLGSGNTTTITSPAPAASRVYTIPDANANANFIMSETGTSQTINGIVRFESAFRILGTSFRMFPSGNDADPGYIIQAPSNPGATRTYTIPDLTANGTFLLSSSTVPANFYETLDSTLALSGTFTGSPVSVNVKYTRSGRAVTMFLASLNAGASGAATFITSAAIPVQFRPTVNTSFIVPVTNVTISTVGSVTVNTSGVLTFGRFDAIGGSAFAQFQNGGTLGIIEPSISWEI